MAIIRLLDARRGLYRKCEELFGDAKIAELIYRYLCDGIEECEDAEPERTKGKWIRKSPTEWMWTCSCCKKDDAYAYSAGESCEPDVLQDLFCPNCGVDMREEMGE